MTLLAWRCALELARFVQPAGQNGRTPRQGSGVFVQISGQNQATWQFARLAKMNFVALSGTFLAVAPLNMSTTSKPQFIHLVARAHAPLEPFLNYEVARKTWHHLKRLFPKALACVLMPNHLHLITVTPSNNSATLRRELQKVGSALMHTNTDEWQPFPKPQVIVDQQHLRRTWRYVLLNPNRKGLVRHPLEWPWSTFRDLIGAAYPRWVNPIALASALNESAFDIQRRLFAYVSKDETVRSLMAGVPDCASPRHRPMESLEQLLMAFSAALKISPQGAFGRPSLRRAFIRFSIRQGWGRPTDRLMALMARFIGVHPRTIRRAIDLASHLPKDDALLRACAVCLTDPLLTSAIPKFVLSTGQNAATPRLGSGYFVQDE